MKFCGYKGIGERTGTSHGRQKYVGIEVTKMITLFRMIRLFQLKTKYRLAFWQFVEKQAAEIMKNLAEAEKNSVTEKKSETENA